jgi:hypothetical protein
MLSAMFALSMIFTLLPAGAGELSKESFSPDLWCKAPGNGSTSWSRVLQLEALQYKSKLQGMERAQVLKLLGEPQRSDEVLPHTSHCIIVDGYSLSSTNDQQFCIEYDNRQRVLSAYVDQTPLRAPRFMGQFKAAANLPEAKAAILSEAKLNSFLSGTTDEKIRKMGAKEVENCLGAPVKSWREQSLVGGRSWHWLTYMYFLSANAHRAFVVRFNAETNQVYEYRIQTVGDLPR